MVTSSTQQTSILLVDDHPANLLALEAVLDPLGQRLVRATSGEEALKQVLVDSFAVILMDVQMPGLDGFQTTALIRQRERSRDTPVIFLTALHKGLEQVRRGYSLGAFDYITKPFEPEIVIAKVAAFVTLYRRGEELKRQSEELQLRERAIGQEIAARQAAEEANRIKELFIGILGHDLQNPLSAISMAANLLTRAGDLPDKHAALAARIARSARRMDRMIGDVLDFTRGRLGGGIPVEPEAADLGMITRQAVEELQLANPTRAIRIDAPRELDGRWDPGRLARLVSNLVANAIHHGADPITITAAEEGDQAVLTVHNGGAAIEPSLVSALFDPFRSGAKHGGGLGLGLYIVQQIAHAHGGTVAAESSDAAGTTFTARLPRNARPLT